MTDAARQTRAILAAYQQVMTASWPDLHPEMAGRAAGWPSATADALQDELRGYLRSASKPDTKPARAGKHEQKPMNQAAHPAAPGQSTQRAGRPSRVKR